MSCGHFVGLDKLSMSINDRTSLSIMDVPAILALQVEYCHMQRSLPVLNTVPARAGVTVPCPATTGRLVLRKLWFVGLRRHDYRQVTRRGEGARGEGERDLMVQVTVCDGVMCCGGKPCVEADEVYRRFGRTTTYP